LHRIRTKPKTQARALKLRAAMTDAETKLWLRLRRGQLNGHHFRKQVPIDDYIADFCCLRAQLVIEVDGGQHGERARQDERRTEALNEAGYRVIRFWNNDVLQNIDGVMEAIVCALQLPRLRTLTSPLPNPPPNRGRG
jgi:lysyl-tRNA synthetase class 2